MRAAEKQRHATNSARARRKKETNKQQKDKPQRKCFFWRNDLNDLSYITSRGLDLMTHFSQLQNYYTSLATFKCKSLTFVVSL